MASKVKYQRQHTQSSHHIENTNRNTGQRAQGDNDGSRQTTTDTQCIHGLTCCTQRGDGLGTPFDNVNVVFVKWHPV